MQKQESLRPHDVCVLLQVALDPAATYRDLASGVGLSLGETHNSAKRLESAGLILRSEDSVNYSGTLEFLGAGVPYVFPGRIGAEVRGVPTAFSAPPLSDELEVAHPVVWPSAKGKARGQALTPLCTSAPETVDTNPELYRLLTVVDAIRIGRARERRLARDYLGRELNRLRDR